jgi:CRISPR/Cas system CMR-associated protein Cmr1 (group 7 of RAMP superfamily)
MTLKKGLKNKMEQQSRRHIQSLKNNYIVLSEIFWNMAVFL